MAATVEARRWFRLEVIRLPRVVVAEDDAELRRLLAGKLRRQGYDVVEVGTGERLAQHLIAEGALSDTDLIVSDIRMPGLSGMDLLAYLQTRGEFPPVALITGFGDQPTRQEAKALGATAFFDKPLDLDELVAWVRSAVPSDAGPDDHPPARRAGRGPEMQSGDGSVRR
jgi:DNA-binding NtrC family response regulator